MPQFGKKKQFTDYFYTRPVAFVLGVVCVLLAVSVYERFTIEREMAERRAQVEQEQQELVERKQYIQDQVEYLEGERGIEEELRKRFDVAKEGEQVIILLGEDDEDVVESSEPEERSKWYEFWLRP